MLRKEEGPEDKPKTLSEKADWYLPISRRDIEPLELARRVRFEEKNVIRVMT